MAFRLASDVKLRIEMLALTAGKDPNDFLRELLMKPSVTIIPQKELPKPKSKRAPWGHIEMKLR